MITQDQKDAIYNALVVGMSLEDAYIYARLRPAQIAAVSEDEDLQAEWASVKKHHEYGLLKTLETIIDKQRHAGKEGAVTWALEHMYPRYSSKPQEEGKQIIISFADSDPADDKEVVEVHK